MRGKRRADDQTSCNQQVAGDKFMYYTLAK